MRRFFILIGLLLIFPLLITGQGLPRPPQGGTATDASGIVYDNSGSTLTAQDVESALDELDAEKGNVSNAGAVTPGAPVIFSGGGGSDVTQVTGGSDGYVLTRDGAGAASWQINPAGSGDVSGPSPTPVVDGNVVRWSGTDATAVEEVPSGGNGDVLKLQAGKAEWLTPDMKGPGAFSVEGVAVRGTGLAGNELIQVPLGNTGYVLTQQENGSVAYNPPSASSAAGSGVWVWSNATNCLGGGVPSSGQFFYNNADPTAVTSICYSETNDDGQDVTTFFTNLLEAGDKLLVQRQNDPDYSVVYKLSGSPVYNTNHWVLFVAYVADGLTGNTMVNNERSRSLFIQDDNGFRSGPLLYSFSTSADCPVALNPGLLSFDNAVPASAAKVCLAEADSVGVALASVYATFKEGDFLYIESTENPASSALFELTSAGTVGGGSDWDWDILFTSDGTDSTFADGEGLRVTHIHSGVVSGFVSNTLAYIDANGEVLSSSCSIDPTETTSVSCPALAATGQGLTLCEAGDNGSDCTTIQLGTVDIPDVTHTVGRDARFPAEHARPWGCHTVDFIAGSDLVDNMFNDTYRGPGFVGTVPVGGHFNTNQSLTCTCGLGRGFADGTTWPQTCTSAVTIGVCDPTVTNGIWASCGNGALLTEKRVSILNVPCTEVGETSTLDAFDTQGGHGNNTIGRCSHNPAVSCATDAACGGGNTCDYILEENDPWIVHNTATLGTGVCDNVGDATDRDPCTTAAQYGTCTAAGGRCVSGLTSCSGVGNEGLRCDTLAERDNCETTLGETCSGPTGTSICFGGDESGIFCDSTADVSLCVDNGGVCKPAWDADVSRITICGELF